MSKPLPHVVGEYCPEGRMKYVIWHSQNQTHITYKKVGMVQANAGYYHHSYNASAYELVTLAAKENFKDHIKAAT